jgi:hypothetical protein
VGNILLVAHYSFQEWIMPTVLRVGAYRFFFFSNEGDEPPHIHVKVESREAKFWLQPLMLSANHGFKAHELSAIQNIIRENQNILLEAWHDHLG